jgi:thiamine pyrophosphokinase
VRAILLGHVFPDVSRPRLKAHVASLGIGPRDLLVGVDAGVRSWLVAGWVPDLAVGDWDSLGPAAREIARQLPAWELPRAKDLSDLAYALKAAIGLGAREIVCSGFTGGRVDQQLGVLYDLASAARGEFGPVRSVCVREPGGEIHFLSSRIRRWKARLRPGTLVSVFAIGGPASGVTLSGLAFGLRRARLVASSRGLSNRALRSEVSVRLERGALAVVVGGLSG